MNAEDAQQWVKWKEHEQYIEALAKDGFIWWQRFKSGKWRKIGQYNATPQHGYMTNDEYLALTRNARGR